MFKTNRDNRSGGKKFGGKSFGGKTPWKKDFGDRNYDKPSFRATCAQCGSDCTVPFRPNGSKPVLCNNCFGKSDGGDSRFKKPSFRDNRSQGDAGSSNTRALEQQLKVVNEKLDQILTALGVE